MLRVTVDDKMKFKKYYIANIRRKVSHQDAVLKPIKKFFPSETRKCLYLTFIIPHQGKKLLFAHPR